VRLVDQLAFADANYVVSIMKTDFSELGHPPEGGTWPRPGQTPPAGWPLYEAAIRWSEGRQ
jgi:hypothetical protein